MRYVLRFQGWPYLVFLTAFCMHKDLSVINDREVVKAKA